MFDRNTIIALVIVGLILILLPRYYDVISPKKAPAPTLTEAPADTVARDAVVSPKDTSQIDINQTVSDEEAKSSLAVDTLAVEPEQAVIETPLYKMSVASNAVVSGYTLKQYKLTSGRPVSLCNGWARTGPRMGMLDFDLGRANVNSIRNTSFSSAKRMIELRDGERDSVVFVAEDSSGHGVRLTYIFYGDRYGFDVALETSRLVVPETGEFRVRWLGGVPVTEPDTARDVQYSASYARVGDAVEKVKASSKEERHFEATGQTYFAAARSKYFMAALIPHEPAAGVEIDSRPQTPRAKASPELYDLSLRQSWKAAAGGRWTVYWGPINYQIIKAYGVGLDETMNWGWSFIKPFSKGVLWALVALHAGIPNYGLVIIVFSVLVKVVLWPLTRKSQVSMKKMSALQPEIKALRETHSKNPQALNQAIMKLYKERGVNPASGCIPMLLQLPVLGALFIVFGATIEFRQSPFMLWITDLSQPDVVFHLPRTIPVYGAGVAILPLIMGVTQFIMSKRTTTDPNQKLMIYIMPIFMTVIFNSFPSGLTLYYTLFNLLAIVEQNLIKLPDFTPSVQVVEEKKKKR